MIDMLLVLVLQTDSISWRTWVATQAHPTLIVAGILAGLWVCYKLRDDWRYVMFNGLLTGHLFIHW